MKRNFSDYVVALSVIVCSLVLLAALTIALTGFRLKKPTRTLQIDFEDVTGVKLHSEVRYAGAPAGRVIALRPLREEEFARAVALLRASGTARVCTFMIAWKNRSAWPRFGMR